MHACEFGERFRQSRPREFFGFVRDAHTRFLDTQNLPQIDRCRHQYQVAWSAVDRLSPTGTFQITNRIANPTYYHPGVVVPAGLNNPLGPRWIGLNKKSYGIHGTNLPHSIGKAASHGCIRLRNSDVVALYSMLSVGDVVEIHGERDATTQRTFGRTSVEQTTAKIAAAPAINNRDRS
jgi:L,D-transpeptidase catalytic domain